MPPNFWLWTLATYFLVERNLICLLADLASVHLCGAVLQPAWSDIQLLQSSPFLPFLLPPLMR